MDYLADGFKPTATRADESIAEQRKYGSQLDTDMKLSREERLKKVKDGFFSR